MADHLPEDALGEVLENAGTHQYRPPDDAGMGISLVRSIVERYGGEIGVADNEPTEARFSLTAPGAASDAPTPGFRTFRRSPQPIAPGVRLQPDRADRFTAGIGDPWRDGRAA
ncbi:hypothetical protein BRC77_00815 [Halobacteriales archaeon QH_8_64_26]|nr:MAG: hypothetical protein BRC77_00815 [Halobacteriales archaeon QH_8_64_26]